MSQFTLCLIQLSSVAFHFHVHQFSFRVTTYRYGLGLFIALGLELCDTEVYKPYVRALLGAAAHYCAAVVLKSRTASLLLSFAN